MSNSNQDSLKWTTTGSRLSAETFGRPADEIVMECRIGVADEHGKRSVAVRALWDTGTSMTVVTPDVARRLQMKPFDTIALNGLKGQSRAVVCAAAVLLPNGLAYGPIAVAVQDLPSTDVLIGMDVISIGKLTIERKPDGGTLFTFDMNI